MINLKLNNSVEMPIFGLGIYKMTNQEELEKILVDYYDPEDCEDEGIDP